MTPTAIPELLAPAGSLDAVRAAVANGADAVYLGAERFNARDEGAQLTLDELGEACRIAHARARRVYLTLNTLVKPAELADALLLLGAAIDRGVDAAIVQDLGLVRLIRATFPGFEIHGSTQMTVHDDTGARVMHELGVERVVLARENTLADIRAIHAAVPELGLESFVHGALCISYSGQCYMSGMISERSANRGSCAQSCRKGYALIDADADETLDEGFLISAKDLGASEHLSAIAASGIGCLKIEGRKKRPEYVATVVRSYRELLARVGRGETETPAAASVQPLVQIFSRGFTGGMFGGRQGRDYVTRTHPDSQGIELGIVVGAAPGGVIVELSEALVAGDGVAFHPPVGTTGPTIGFHVTSVGTLDSRRPVVRQLIRTEKPIPTGWRVVRSAQGSLLDAARASLESVARDTPAPRRRLHVRVFGAAGAPLECVFSAEGDAVTVHSAQALVPATKRALDVATLREQFGRLGATSFVLGSVDAAAVAPALFLPISELNHLRQRATDELTERARCNEETAAGDRVARIAAAIADVPLGDRSVQGSSSTSFILAATVWRVEDARLAARAGATEVVLDPFLRHPAPPRSRVRILADELAGQGVVLRIRTPTIVRPEERHDIDPWLDLDLPLVSGHLGLLATMASAGRDVVADYAVNCFNQHTAAQLFHLGARRIVHSIELTAEEALASGQPWHNRGFDSVIYGRPEGMTIEHCVLSAAFDRVPTTCRDLCVRKHPNVTLTDPAGYAFPVATDSACRNRLLHSLPIEASEYLPRLWAGGVRGYRVLFTVPGDDVATVVRSYREMLDDLASRGTQDNRPIRAVVGRAFTRGHFARAV